MNLIYRKFFKRVVDFLFSLTIVLILSPILFLIFIISFISNRGKAFFLQERPGLNEKSFRVIKFKTMTDEKDQAGNLLPNNMRITRAGRFFRKYSIDELPQLFNVLKGEMSLVGPRPLLFRYIPLYSTGQRRRHSVRPGITGWAQVNGRNAITWTKKFELDVWYVDNISFYLDLKILWKTVLKWIRPEGINATENVTMPPFDGKN